MNTSTVLPKEWIERIFLRMKVIYGPAMMAGVWGDQLNEVVAGWAEELGRFKDHPGAIKYALEHLPSDYPPNLLQFKEICREGMKLEPKPLALERKFTEEEAEKNLRRYNVAMQEIKSKLVR